MLQVERRPNASVQEGQRRCLRSDQGRAWEGDKHRRSCYLLVQQLEVGRMDLDQQVAVMQHFLLDRHPADDNPGQIVHELVTIKIEGG